MRKYSSTWEVEVDVEAFVVFPKYCQEHKGVLCLKPQRNSGGCVQCVGQIIA